MLSPDQTPFSTRSCESWEPPNESSTSQSPIQSLLSRKRKTEQYGPSAVVQLRKLERWGDGPSWTTLLAHGDEQGSVRCETDVSVPHAVPREQLDLDRYPVYDIFTLSVIREAKSPVPEVSTRDGRVLFLKIARFPHELRWLVQEIQAYHVLPGSCLASRLIGYVSEPGPGSDRVVGLLVEKVEGRTAEFGNLESCRQALKQLHRHLVHGDLCKYNILITPRGPKFIDFEDSVLVGSEGWSAELEKTEMESLEAKLADTSGAGRPWE